MLYDTIKNEGAMQKAAGDIRSIVNDFGGEVGTGIYDAASKALHKTEGLANKGMQSLLDKGGIIGTQLPFAGIGSIVGAATNDGNRVAGTLGGGVGGSLGALAAANGHAWLAKALAKAGRNIPGLGGGLTDLATIAAGGIGSLAGGYGGGKLGAYLDRKSGNTLTNNTNSAINWLKSKIGLGGN